jgi:hypothetical protein
MVISLDYDKTFTEDPALWLQFIEAALKQGHQVICCTFRYEKEGYDMDPRLLKKVKVYFTSRQPKRRFMQALGVDVNVWIDDEPHFIVGW